VERTSPLSYEQTVETIDEKVFNELVENGEIFNEALEATLNLLNLPTDEPEIIIKYQEILMNLELY